MVAQRPWQYLLETERREVETLERGGGESEKGSKARSELLPQAPYHATFDGSTVQLW